MSSMTALKDLTNTLKFTLDKEKGVADISRLKSKKKIR